MDALSLIRRRRCNSYLNLRGVSLTLELWEEIYKLIIEDAVAPRISSVDLRDTNLNIKISDYDKVNCILE